MARPTDPFASPLTSPFGDRIDTSWQREEQLRREVEHLRRMYGSSMPMFGSGSAADTDTFQQRVMDMVNTEIKRFNEARKLMETTVDNVTKQVAELRMLYDYVYKYHPEVIGEFDVVQRAKERIK